jgi:hypothetical protein
MRRAAAVLLCLALAACGGDNTPLPPITVGSQWMPLMMDTTGNLMLRRMAVWVDTAHVAQSPAGYALVSQKMMMDMKIGGMSTSMQMRTEIDCAGKRMRVVGLDSMTASMKGVPMPDSIARQAMAQQASQASTDTTWKTVGEAAGTNGTMLSAICAKAAAVAPVPPKADSAGATK